MSDFKPLRKAMVVIAVSNYQIYPALPGTLTSARRIAAWAEQPGDGRGYKVIRITDEAVDGAPGQPVTAERIKTALSELLETTIIDRLVIYFAGHGVARSVGEEFWLLTDAAVDRSQCVGVMAFKDALKVYGIGSQHPELSQGQLVIIADACRNVDPSSIDLYPNPILTRRGTSRLLETDIFRATTLGTYAYQVEAVEGGEPYCLFSSVLCDALEGTVDDVIERTYHPNSPAIINDKLVKYLYREVPRRAAALNETMEPDNQANIRAYHNYYDILRPARPVDQSDDTGADQQFLPPIDLPDFSTSLRHDMEPPSRSAGSEGAVFRPRPILPLPPRRTDLDLPYPVPAPPPSPGRRIARMPFEPAPDHAAGLRRSLARADQLCGQPDARLSAPPQVFFDGRPDIAVPKRAAGATSTARFGHRYQPESALADAPIFVRQERGWTLVPLLQNTTSVVLEELPGDVLLRTADTEDWDLSLSSAASVLGRPDRLSDAKRLGDDMREAKQAAPNRGIRASYLYRMAGDDENVVRTANFMSEYGLPIDVALLAADRLSWHLHDTNLQVFADLPAVAEDPDDTRAYYARRAFPARVQIPVWGLVPMHRQGWHLFATAATADGIDGPPILRDAAASLLPSAAVSFDDTTVQRLCETFNYVIARPTG